MLRPVVILTAFFLCSCIGPPQRQNLKVIGSDTEVNLVLELAESYMDGHPDASIAVSGGGSGAGIAALINGRTDFANSSRPITSEEVSLANDAGIDPVPLVFACDAIVFIVHQEFKVDSLSWVQLKQLFSGEIQRWEDISEEKGSVSLYGRQGNSGTYVYLRDMLLKSEYSPTMKCMNGNAQIVESVRHDPHGIGFVSAGYVFDTEWRPLNGIKVLKISGKTGEKAADPADRATLFSGAYPLIRPLYHYSDGKPQGLAFDFLRFETGSDGKSIIIRNGYLPVLPPYDSLNTSLFP